MNRYGIGAKVTLYYNHRLSYQEEMPMRGFESTVDSRLNFGLGRTEKIDSVVVDWPDGRENIVRDVKPNQTIGVRQSESVAGKAGLKEAAVKTIFKSSATDYGLDFVHHEDEFNESTGTG